MMKRPRRTGPRLLLLPFLIWLFLPAGAVAQTPDPAPPAEQVRPADPAPSDAAVRLSVLSQPADAKVYVRYAGQGDERYLGRTPGEGGTLELDLQAGPAELVVFKTGYLAKVQPLELRQGGAARLEVRLTRDIEIPRHLTLKDPRVFVRNAREGDKLYLAVLAHVHRLFVEEIDPRRLIESSVETLVEVLNAVRARELLLRRELSSEARKRYYGEEVDLTAYPRLELRRTPGTATDRYELGASSVGIVGETDPADLDSYLHMLRRVYAFIKDKWDVRRLLSDTALTRCAIEGLLGALGDDHTHFLTPDDVEAMDLHNKAAFGGVGIVVGMRDGQLTVVAPMEGTPGQRAGILAGDRILSIDGELTSRLTLKQAVDCMRGEIDSPVELTIRRGEREPFTVTILRARIKVPQTSHEMVEKGIGYLRVTSFMAERLVEEVQGALAELQAEGARGVILDLRNNPGGLLTQAHAVAELFVPAGELVVTTRTRLPGEARTLVSEAEGPRLGLPLVVLQNGGSASASEILAGTLKEHGLATLVGEKTFGKGSVQRVLPLDPFRCGLALTTATYHLPSGATPHKVGVEADVVVSLSEEEQVGLSAGEEPADRQLEAAVRELQRALAGDE